MTAVTSTAPALARIAEIRSRFAPTATVAGRATATTAPGAIASPATHPLTGLLGLDQPAPTVAAGGASSVAGQSVVAAASEYLGVPYVWGGTNPDTGLDCSGFVQRTYRDLGVELPRVSRDQARVGTEVASIAEAQPGDLVAFGQPVDHIAIYVGDNRIIHAPRRGDVVKVAEIQRPITTIRRVVAGDAALAAPVATPAAPTTPVLGGAGGLSAADTLALRQLVQLLARPGLAAGLAPGLSPALASPLAPALSPTLSTTLSPSPSTASSWTGGTL